jgi:hypothetical protein
MVYNGTTAAMARADDDDDHDDDVKQRMLMCCGEDGDDAQREQPVCKRYHFFVILIRARYPVDGQLANAPSAILQAKRQQHHSIECLTLRTRSMWENRKKNTVTTNTH